jgi:hypothetical protein
MFYPSCRDSSLNYYWRGSRQAYYPFSRRLRNAYDKGKLIMDGDISLEDLGDLSPPIPRALDFIGNVPGSDTITDSPLLLFQVSHCCFQFNCYLFLHA